ERSAPQGGFGPDAREADPERGCFGKLLSPARRRRCGDHIMAKFSISERFACKVLGQHRSTQRKKPRGRADEEALTADIIRLASRYGRYGYRRITAMLRSEGWTVNAKRVERIWRREGLKVPQKQPKRGRLWLNDGSCIRLRPEHPGPMTSSRAGPMMPGSFACSTVFDIDPQRRGVLANLAGITRTDINAGPRWLLCVLAESTNCLPVFMTRPLMVRPGTVAMSSSPRD